MNLASRQRQTVVIKPLDCHSRCCCLTFCQKIRLLPRSFGFLRTRDWSPQNCCHSGKPFPKAPGFHLYRKMFPFLTKFNVSFLTDKGKERKECHSHLPD